MPTSGCPRPSTGKRLIAAGDRSHHALDQAGGALLAALGLRQDRSGRACREFGDQAWPKNDIDRFLLARLEKEKLPPSPEADRYALVRRLALDLTGLPPTIAEVDPFVSGPRSRTPTRSWSIACSARASFGEHWARMWLDLARYADSAGYVSDVPREIWAFRDYVIRSLNANKPFDQFTIEQIAGDLLPNPSEEQIIATAFHRNTQTNNEGGSDREEYRNVADRRSGQHDDVGLDGHDDGLRPVPRPQVRPDLAEGILPVLRHLQQHRRRRPRGRAPRPYVLLRPAEAGAEKLEAEIAQTAVKVSLKEKVDDLESAWRRSRVLPCRSSASCRRANAARRSSSIAAISSTAGRKSAKACRPRSIRCRKMLPPNRLALARWLVDAEQSAHGPRAGQSALGKDSSARALVLTSEDFGTQGDLPSHPELLDYLATELVASHWDIKHMHPLDGHDRPPTGSRRESRRSCYERDPDNRLLARGPRFRLDAEAVRDQSLAVAGLLSAKMYGPPVRPLQPSFGLSAAFGGGMDWHTSEGEDRFRRAIYTSWRRTNPYPSMITFDSPSREVCTLRRPRTNTPLQALVTWNDPVYVEAAQALARRLDREGGPTPADKGTLRLPPCAWRGLPPRPKRPRLTQLYEQARERFTKQPQEARKLATRTARPAARRAQTPCNWPLGRPSATCC